MALLELDEDVALVLHGYLYRTELSTGPFGQVHRAEHLALFELERAVEKLFPARFPSDEMVAAARERLLKRGVNQS